MDDGCLPGSTFLTIRHLIGGPLPSVQYLIFFERPNKRQTIRQNHLGLRQQILSMVNVSPTFISRTV